MQLAESTMVILRRAAWVAALVAVAFSWSGRRIGLLEFRPGGVSFDNVIRPVFLWIFIAALVLAIKWEIAGGVLAGFAAAGLVAFATHQLVAPHAALVIATFAVPAVLWIVIDLNDVSGRRAMISIGIALGLAVTGFFIGEYVYERIWGPTHPESQVEALPDSPVEWVWSGSLTADSAEVRFKAREGFTSARLALAESADLVDATMVDAAEEIDAVGAFTLDELRPGTRYHYAVELDGELDTTRAGTFQTFPEGRASFTVALGACARVGSNGRVFDAIREQEPLLYMIIGDFHYGDNDTDDIDNYREVMDLTLTRPGQAALYRSAPVAYMWDDHDYGANDSGASSVARAAAWAGYREYVPSYELAGPESAIYQAFTIGRVRIVLTDARSERSDQDEVDDEDKTMLGQEQKRWFKQEILSASASHELVVWVNPVPWVSEPDPGADDWGGYTTERRELAEYVAANDIDNLLMVSGDAHMVAIDDGSNTNYSSEPGPAFPLIHSAALDRPGGVKGGPYSEGAVGGGGQFATMTIIDDGGPMEVELTALDWEGTTLIDYRFTVPASSATTSTDQ